MSGVLCPAGEALGGDEILREGPDTPETPDGLRGPVSEMCRNGLIYVVQESDDGPVKIGKSNFDALDGRISGLQTGNPRPLYLRRVIRTDTEADACEIEARLHARFASHGIARNGYRTEWFELKGEIREFTGLFKDREAEPSNYTLRKVGAKALNDAESVWSAPRYPRLEPTVSEDVEGAVSDAVSEEVRARRPKRTRTSRIVTRELGDQLCECGCGKLTYVGLTSKKPNRSLQGHGGCQDSWAHRLGREKREKVAA